MVPKTVQVSRGQEFESWWVSCFSATCQHKVRSNEFRYSVKEKRMKNTVLEQMTSKLGTVFTRQHSWWRCSHSPHTKKRDWSWIWKRKKSFDLSRTTIATQQPTRLLRLLSCRTVFILRTMPCCLSSFAFFGYKEAERKWIRRSGDVINFEKFTTSTSTTAPKCTFESMEEEV